RHGKRYAQAQLFVRREVFKYELRTRSSAWVVSGHHIDHVRCRFAIAEDYPFEGPRRLGCKVNALHLGPPRGIAVSDDGAVVKYGNVCFGGRSPVGVELQVETERGLAAGRKCVPMESDARGRGELCLDAVV